MVQLPRGHLVLIGEKDRRPSGLWAVYIRLNALGWGSVERVLNIVDLPVQEKGGFTDRSVMTSASLYK